MNNLTKTLTAATLALGAVSVNAAILHDNSLDAEAWMSVYDSTSKQTFTLDLGGTKIGNTQGITVRSLIEHKNATGSLVNVDLTEYSHWNEFTSHADFNASTTIYLVTTSGIDQSTFSPNVLITGTSDKFGGLDMTALGQVSQSINVQALNINTDTPGRDFKNFPANVTTLVIDGDDHIGHHQEGASSTELWGGATYDPNGLYGQAIPFQFANVETDNQTFEAQQMAFAAEWKLDGDSLTLASSVSAVPVPAAVWMFGSALLGLVGVNRKRKMA